MTHQDVRPLFEDPSAPAELRNFASLARSDGPSHADLERLAGRVGRAVGVPAGVLLAGSAASAGALGTPPAELGAAAQSGATAKLGALGKLFASGSGKLLAVGLAAGIGAGVWAYARPRPAQDTRGQLVQPAAAPVLAPPEGAEPRSPAAARQPRTASAESAARAAAPLPVVTPLATNPQRAAPVRVAPAKPSSRRGPVAQVTAPVKQEPDAIEPEAPPPPALELPSELSLIQRAEAARSHGTEALQLLATHERLYPHGALAQEREVLAIELLFKVGEPQRARARAARFERSHPSSAHLPRVRALLERAGDE